MSFATSVKAGLAAMIKCAGQTATISGTAYDCARTEISSNLLYLDDGQLQAYSFSLRFSFSDTGWTEATAPAVDSLVTFSGVVYRVMAISVDGMGSGITLHLGAQYQGARS